MLSFKQAMEEHMQLEMNARRAFEQSIASFAEVPEAYDVLTNLRELLRRGAQSLPAVLHEAIVSIMQLKPLVQKKYPASMPTVWRAATELNKSLQQLQPMSGIPTEELMARMRGQPIPQRGGIADVFKKKQTDINFKKIAEIESMMRLPDGTGGMVLSVDTKDDNSMDDFRRALELVGGPFPDADHSKDSAEHQELMQTWIEKNPETWKSRNSSINFSKLAEFIGNDELELFNLIEETERLVPEAADLCSNIKTAALHSDFPKGVITEQLKIILNLKLGQEDK